MADKKIIWHKVSEEMAFLPWQANGMCIVEAGGKKITLAKLGMEVYAFAHKCPHASGIMADGHINAAGQVSCPLHRYRFDMRNGRNSSGEGYFLKTYLVNIRPDGLYIGWEDKGLLSIW